jgi:NADP-dependent 3-hydroxy acid dehydrogenase YdfG
MKRPLDGMVVAITGASAGIGRALALQLGRRGARLALGARRLERLEEVDRELGGGHLVRSIDVARREDCEFFVQAALSRFGRLDTLVCNAGYGVLRTVAEMTPGEWQAILAANLMGTVDCVRPAIPALCAQEPRAGWRGQIMVVSSCLARRAGPEGAAYAATKAAQLSLAEALRVELRPALVAVTSVHPIGTESEFFTAAEARSGRAMVRDAHEPRQTPEQVAAAMVRAIERPRAEVWPHRASRWVFGAATLFPGLVDGIVARRWSRQARAGVEKLTAER